MRKLTTNPIGSVDNEYTADNKHKHAIGFANTL